MGMSDAVTNSTAGTILLVGASRGLGQAMAAELARRGWKVVGTVRGGARTGLHDLADMSPGQIEVQSLDITDAAGIAALRGRLSGRCFDILFVNAGTANRNQDEGIAEVSTEEFVHVMLTNALGVMRAVEGLQELVRPDGLVGVMSSGQGSVGNNTNGGHEVYRGSKAALNHDMRSYAARPEARFSVEESIPKIVDVLLSQQGRPGLRYLDRDGNTVPW